MKPNLQFDASFLPNEDQFTDPFFKRFTLRHAPQPLALTGAITKNYKFPTFYGDVTCAMAIFLCSYERAQALLPHPKMKPVSMPGGRAVVTISCYEYKNVMNVPSYNELACTIPVLIDPAVSVPVLPLLWNGYPNAGYYVFHMPVTSLENRIRGNNIWGLPKVVEEIDIREEGSDCVTTCFDEQGKEYFKLRVPMQGKPTAFDVSAYLYSKLGSQLVRGQTNFKATFNVTKNMQVLWKKNAAPDRTYLELGNTSPAPVFKKLEIDPNPFQFRFAKHMNAAFDLPEAGYRAPFRF
jgi:hypothetical protein